MRVHNPQKGFTLVETLVAITVLLLSIVGPMVMSARGLQTSFHARDQLTAVQLAQEGIEIIRDRRDREALSRAVGHWTGLTPAQRNLCRRDYTGCGVDIRGGAFIDCTNTNACVVDYTDGPLLGAPGRRGFYAHLSPDAPTPFTRRIWVEEKTNGFEIEVSVEVSWRSSLFPPDPLDPTSNIQSVLVQSRIFNQYDNI